MKNLRRYIKIMLPITAALALASCSLDELDEQKKPIEQNGQWGSLTIESLTVNLDNESLDRGSNSVTRTDDKTYMVPNPNGVNEDLGNYWIEVFDADGEVVDINGDATAGTGLTYGAVADLNEGEGTPVTLLNGETINLKGIVLPPGEYTVWAYKDSTKGAEIANVAEDKKTTSAAGETSTTPAYYMGNQTVTVVSAEDLEGNATSTPVEITCKLAQTIVTVEMSADMLKWFDEKNEYGVTNGTPLQTIVTIAPKEPAQGVNYSHTFPYASNHGVESTTVTGENAVTTIDGGPFVYFKDHAGANDKDGNTMSFKMEGVYLNVSIDDLEGVIADLETNKSNSTYCKNLTYVSMEREISGVKAAQWRRISIDIDHNTEGDVQFEVTIDSYVFDEEINVDVQTLFFSPNYQEEEVPDINPLAPSVSILNNSSDNPLKAVIADDLYSSSAEGWLANLQVEIAPSGESAIKEVYADINSDNDDLMEALESAGYTDGRVYFKQDDTTRADVVNYFKVDNLESGNMLITLTDAGMTTMQNDFEGTHIVKVYTEDDENRANYVTLTIVSGATTGGTIGNTTGGGGSGGGVYDSNPPTIEWVGHNIEEPYDLTSAGIECRILVNSTAEGGFTKFEVDISSAVLTEEELSGVGLGTHIDLINPGEMLAGLQGLGFLPNGKTSYASESQADFDITGFMTMLHSISSEGLCEFKLTVGDKNGETEGTIQLNIVVD